MRSSQRSHTNNSSNAQIEFIDLATSYVTSTTSSESNPLTTLEAARLMNDARDSHGAVGRRAPAAASRSVNAGDWMDLAWGPTSNPTATACSSVSALPGRAVA